MPELIGQFGEFTNILVWVVVFLGMYFLVWLLKRLFDSINQKKKAKIEMV